MYLMSLTRIGNRDDVVYLGHYHTSTLILWLVTYCVNYTSTLCLVTFVRLNAASCLVIQLYII